MLYVKRYADHPISEQYPLETNGSTTWSKNEQSVWETKIQLPEIAENNIIVPSYSSLDPSNKYQFTFHGNSSHDLYPVPSPENFKPEKETVDVSGHIDCWHSKTQIVNGEVVLRIDQKTEPSNYLITLSIRELISQTYGKTTNALRTQTPEGLSQMSADKKIRDRICSPTATAMALSLNHRSIIWSEIIEECYDPATKAYGSWPLAIRCASNRGFIGSIEANQDWSSAASVLKSGQPLVCSIRFKPGELTGSPLKQTSGHLVCVYGIEEDTVLALDPAEKNEKNIKKRYDLEEFSKAWLEQRGAAYYFFQAT